MPKYLGGGAKKVQTPSTLTMHSRCSETNVLRICTYRFVFH